jgi:predicted nucleic acid-binding protein
MVLDASAAIVLWATGRIREVVDALPAPVFVVRETVDEVRYLRNPAISAKSGSKEPVDWQPLLSDGLIGMLERTHPQEFAEFVRLAQLVDEGEAAAAAAALHRGFDLVIDDLKARRVLAGSVRLIWSLDILHQWCHGAKVPPGEIRTMLTNIRQRATLPSPPIPPQIELVAAALLARVMR